MLLSARAADAAAATDAAAGSAVATEGSPSLAALSLAPSWPALLIALVPAATTSSASAVLATSSGTAVMAFSGTSPGAPAFSVTAFSVTAFSVPALPLLALTGAACPPACCAAARRLPSFGMSRSLSRPSSPDLRLPPELAAVAAARPRRPVRSPACEAWTRGWSPDVAASAPTGTGAATSASSDPATPAEPAGTPAGAAASGSGTSSGLAPRKAGWPSVTPKISCRQITTAAASISAARTATPMEIATSNRLPATTPVASSPIAITTTDRTMPNRITRGLRSPGQGQIVP